MAKIRLDALVFERGLVPSRERAKTTIMSGLVFVNGQRADKPGAQVAADATVELRGEGLKYVSRGGYKLERALEQFGIDVTNRVCADIGASTGGFTDCLLQRGAARVFAVDVGYGQLAWSLRTDPRVTVLERVNARGLTPETLGGTVDFATVDVSFISLRLILPAVRTLLNVGGEVVCLVKPQFEAGRGKVGKNGVVRDIATHIEVLEAALENAKLSGFSTLAMTHSPIRGPEGNIEFLSRLTLENTDTAIDCGAVARAAHAEFSTTEVRDD
ncbi:MAG: TlyA family RNA methyltransferase [Oscillospiraceae bacterium]|nr:TlyA family RNA methyltransferase [Oscillospiraceae bacterium]